MSPQQNRHDAQEALDTINKRTGRNMPQAVATAVVLIVLVAGIALLSTQVFAYLILVFMLLGIWELRVDFATIGIHIPPVALWICSAFMLLSTFYAPEHGVALGASLLLSLLVVSVSAAFNPFSGTRVHRAVASKLMAAGSARPPSASAKPANQSVGGRIWNVCISIFAVLYIPLLASFLILLLVQPQASIKVMMAIFIPAMGDTGGLIFGAAFGKHKLSPRISPKKSYEGLAGSILFTVIGTTLFYAFSFQSNFLAGGWWKPIVLGIVVAITGTFGDLCASMLKRDMGIKDMGHLLAGHGGILDRVDSILISAPFTFALLALFGV